MIDDDIRALVERLEARRKTVTYAIADGTHQTFAEADPDCQEAAAALTALADENARLREAVVKLLYVVREDADGATEDAAVTFSRAALGALP